MGVRLSGDSSVVVALHAAAEAVNLVGEMAFAESAALERDVAKAASDVVAEEVGGGVGARGELALVVVGEARAALGGEAILGVVDGVGGA